MMTRTLSDAESAGRNGALRRLWVSLFMLLFAVIGLSLCGESVKTWMTDLKTRRRPRVPCIVIQSGVIGHGRGGGPYALDIRFKYQRAGKTFTSARYSLAHQPSYDYAAQERIALRYPTGASAACFVDPSDPSQALLAFEPEHSWPNFALGLLVIFAGTSPIWRWWRCRKVPSDAAATPARAVPSSGENSRGRRLGLAVICTVLILLGVAILYTEIRSARRARDARTSWRTVQCAILSSSVAEHPGGGEDGPTYSVDVLYEYEVAGQRYRSNQFNFADHDSSRQIRELLLAERYPVGRPSVCFVNPADSTDAVLEPNVGGQRWVAIVPIVLIIIGVAGLAALLRSRTRFSVAGTIASSSTVSSHLASPGDGTLILHPIERPAIQFAFIFALTVLWVGLFAVVLRLTISGRLGQTIAPMILVVLCGIAGLILVVGAIAGFISLFDPRVALKLSRAEIAPGGFAELQWTCYGRYDRIQRLVLQLEGRETVVYGSGSEAQNQERLFTTIPVHETERPEEMARGKCTLHVPQGVMPTFCGSHNKIRWILVVHGQMRRGPGINNVFELNVVPPPVRNAASVVGPALAPSSSVDSRGAIGIQTARGRTNFMPGEVVTGTVSWSLRKEPKQIQVRLFWFTRGKGTPDLQVALQALIGDSKISGEQSFSLQVPNGPYSFTGNLISIVWGLEAVVEPTGQSDRIEIVCAPAGRSIDLGTSSSP
jgi:hypothetical protein